LIISLAGALIATYANKPEDDAVLMEFYRRVRPWGFWGPVRDKVMKADPTFQPNKDFFRDMFNIGVGTVWQTCFILLAIYLVIRSWSNAVVTLVILAVTFLILKKSWYDRLPPPSVVPATDPETQQEETGAAAH
jgi:hypothetical protein